MARKALIAAVITLALVAGAGGVLFAFGTPVRTASSTATTSPVGTTPPAPVAAEEPQAESPAVDRGGDPHGEQAVPEPDPSSPLAIEIPGCVCHSDDPELVTEHQGYRMNQCAGCHAGGVPTGQ